MGLLSMAVAAVFMVRQRDFKRMLAYSSVEHMGILVLGIGIGGLAVYGALLHLINNGLTKGVLFLSAGNIHRAYGSKLTDDVRGAIAAGAAVRRAVPGRLPGHHRLASVRAVRQRVHHRQRRDRQRPVRRRRPVPAAAGRRLHRHGGHGPGRRPGERRRSRSEPTAFTTASAPACPILLFMALVLLLGLYIPPPLESLLREAAAFLEVKR